MEANMNSLVEAITQDLDDDGHKYDEKQPSIGSRFLRQVSDASKNMSTQPERCTPSRSQSQFDQDSDRHQSLKSTASGMQALVPT
jgi:hypothetical protein